MQNKKSKLLLNCVVIALVATTTLTASIMAGCNLSNDEKTKETKVVSETQIVTEIETYTEIATDSEGNTVYVEKTRVKNGSDEDGKSADSESKADNEKAESNDSGNNGSAEKAESSDKGDDTSESESSKKHDDKGDSSDSLNIDGESFNVGDTVTCIMNVKTPGVAENYQATLTYDGDYLEVTKAKLVGDATSGGIINYKNPGVIKFNGSNISSGYDYTDGGAFLEITYKVKDSGSTKPSINWEIVREATEKGGGVNYADNGLTYTFNYS